MWKGEGGGLITTMGKKIYKNVSGVMKGKILIRKKHKNKIGEICKEEKYFNLEDINSSVI